MIATNVAKLLGILSRRQTTMTGDHDLPSRISDDTAHTSKSTRTAIAAQSGKSIALSPTHSYRASCSFIPDEVPHQVFICAELTPRSLSRYKEELSASRWQGCFCSCSLPTLEP
jgi:hypothetical protein